MTIIWKRSGWLLFNSVCFVWALETLLMTGNALYMLECAMWAINIELWCKPRFYRVKENHNV